MGVKEVGTREGHPSLDALFKMVQRIDYFLSDGRNTFIGRKSCQKPDDSE